MATTVAPLQIPARIDGNPRLHPVGPAAGEDSLMVCLGDSWDDVDEALSIVHTGFVEAGYMAPQRSGRRMIAQYLNPGTVFITARLGGHAAGVLVLIPDGPFGLPSDRAFREEIDELRRSGEPLFEGSSMVVLPEFRRHTRRIVGGLVAAAFLIMSERPGFRVVISVEPRQEGFYGSFVDTWRLGSERPLYGAPATLLSTDGPRMVGAMFANGTNGGRMLRDRVLAPDSGWREDRRVGATWPPASVAALLDEQDCLSSLLGQIQVLGTVAPALLAGI